MGIWNAVFGALQFPMNWKKFSLYIWLHKTESIYRYNDVDFFVIYSFLELLHQLWQLIVRGHNNLTKLVDDKNEIHHSAPS